MSAHVIAVDVGTSAVRAALVHADGHIVSASHLPRASSLGGETFEAESLHKEVLAALAGLADHPVPSALAIAAHIGTVAVAADVEPVDLGGGWADSRGTHQLSAIDHATAQQILRASGRPALTGGALAYLLGLDPGHAVRVGTVLSPKDYLVARLTGRLATDTINAAYTLAADVRRRSWNISALEQLGLEPSLFPPQVEPVSVVGELTAGAAAATGLPVGLPVVAGGPDGSVGIGLLLGTDQDLIADVAGTTDVVGRLLPRAAEAPDGAVLNPSVLPGRFVVGGATGLTGGAVARWRSLVGSVEDARLAEIPPGANGLTVIPTMTGSRFPRWRPGSRGAVLGQRPEHEAAHLLRAAQEAATFTVREGLDLLDPSGRLPVALAGGSARSAHVAQLRADALARPLLVSSEPDVTLLGAASLAFAGSGEATDPDELRSRLLGGVREIEPDAARSARYAELYSAWLRTRDTIDEAQD
ncbi:xylulokinase [Saccharopolyspora phatthalungensis]|uniref:Sugar (Pentulose or hexulose) kinase n=1 Tax=Saccharopolyspora phatthalungensis TaxID=664693 RepID=A0A840QJA0_9PSEU|nr:FGGY-family carbohydrate kinase [Saccharopolyspora phatthalungensis]MBB5157753.1 sugar (pentulose or hexulose) kinase [Saccharopolyspora phatthalungensis]